MLAALEAPTGTYDVSDGNPLRRSDLVSVLAQALGSRRLRTPPAALTRGAAARTQVRSHRLSVACFARASGWRPRWPSAREGWRGVVDAWEGGRRAA